MHYTHLDHLYPIFEDLVDCYMKKCPLEFENQGEAIITSFIDAICDEDCSEVLRSKAILSLVELQKTKPNELNNFIVTAIGNINLVGNMEEKKDIIYDALPLELKPIWKDLNHQEIMA
jgi:hypothetical protein